MWSCPSRRRPGGALVTPSRGRPLDLDELIQVQRRSDLLFDGLHALIDVPMPVLGGWELSYCLNYMPAHKFKNSLAKISYHFQNKT